MYLSKGERYILAYHGAKKPSRLKRKHLKFMAFSEDGREPLDKKYGTNYYYLHQRITSEDRL